MRIVIIPLVAAVLIALPAAAQQPKPKAKDYGAPKSLTPPPEVLRQIETKTAQLAAKIAELRKDPKRAEKLPDIEIFLRAAQNIVRLDEFFEKASGQWTLECLDRGLERAELLAKDKLEWKNLGGKDMARAYRSWIDGSPQPYGLTFPLDYDKAPERRWRVDIVLHGRNPKLTEVAFLHAHNGSRKVSPEQNFIQVDIFGRGNNAYRWAGEMDVWEVLAEIADDRDFRADRSRYVLRGFSMGGAGTWHLGLHHPSAWCVIGPGAGFTSTHGYVAGLPNPLPPYKESCLRIYDALDYAENAVDLPIVAYSGGDDPQKLAADNIEKRLRQLNINTMTHIVAPGLGHTFPPEWFKKANALWSANVDKESGKFPSKITFTTYTTMFAICSWLTVTGLEKHYEKATVEAELVRQEVRIKSKNIQGLRIRLPGSAPKDSSGQPRFKVNVNGQDLSAECVDIEGSFLFQLVQNAGKWSATKMDFFGPTRKRPHLQGPIDDAFVSPFVCVLGSGDTWHPATKKHLDAKLAAFRHDWAKHWRGELPTTGDYAVTPNDIMDKNLILFGDPNSNLTLAQIMPKLPLTWTKDEIVFAGKKYSSAEHVPVLIFPNPLNPKRYVVLNTGHTFPSADYTKSNAMLFPRLGDYAVLKLAPTERDAAGYEVATAGLFDELWQP